MPAPRSVLNGRYAEASLGGVLIALLFDWEAQVETDTADTTAHNDKWKHFVPLDSGWTFRARGYIIPGSAAHYINSLWAANAQPGYVTVAGFSGTVGAGTKIFEGTGLPVRGQITAPMELAEQEFEIRGDGAPTAGV